MKNYLLRLAMLASSLSIFVSVHMNDRTAMIALYLISPALVLALAVLLGRKERPLRRILFFAIALLAGSQLAVVALYSTVLSNPSGLELGLWPLVLAMLTTALSVLTLIPRPTGPQETRSSA